VNSNQRDTPLVSFAFVLSARVLDAGGIRNAVFYYVLVCAARAELVEALNQEFAPVRQNGAIRNVFVLSSRSVCFLKSELSEFDRYLRAFGIPCSHTV